ncbi:MAG TPA: Gfo/Idh/MocA family oxidoreductase [Burkholderiales bacterium]|nr:Gfo/Idh/MocA family oxidoreductase [Burkholderiales bacterium]
MSRMPVVVIGAGVIGRTHIDRALRHGEVSLAGIADPAPGARVLAEAAGVAWDADFEALLGRVKPAAAVVATPNATHAEIAVRCIGRGVAPLVEKPIAHDLAGARRIRDAGAASGVPVLVGHQRRHNRAARRARKIIAAGELGRPVCATVLATWLKPDAYFEASWRREPGGGPILINLIHDLDLMRFLFGEIDSVQAFVSSAVRGHAVEDSAAVIARFANGALATFTVSDTATAPWNYDLASGEAERFPRQDVDAYFVSGTEGSLTLPRLERWSYRERRGWEDPIVRERAALHAACPYAEQLRHLRALVEGREAPVCSADDALGTLAAAMAVHEAARSGRPVSPQRNSMR